MKKKLLILAAVAMLTFSFAGQAMAAFSQGDLIEVVYDISGSGPEVAVDLGISPGTVKIHLQHIFAKAGVRDRSALVAASAALLSGGLCEAAAASEPPRANGSYGIANFSLAKA